MNNSIESFSFDNTNLRIIDNKWFVAKDICDGLDIKDSAKVVREINSTITELGKPDAISTRISLKVGKQMREVVCVNETGLNLLIFQSRKKSAFNFKYWIASEVLPSIRETGAYIEPPKPPTLTPPQQNHIQKRVKQLVAQQIGSSYSSMWGSIKDKFHVGTYKDIEADKYPELCEFLRCEPIAEVIEPSNVLSLPSGLVAINETRLNDLVAKIETLNQCVNTIDRIYGEIVDSTNEVVYSINYPATNPNLN